MSSVSQKKANKFIHAGLGESRKGIKFRKQYKLITNRFQIRCLLSRSALYN